MNTNLHPTMVQALKGLMPPARKRHAADLESRIAGMPCGIRIDGIDMQAPQPWNDASDWDNAGYCEIEFTVLDRKGYEAPWLQAKLTDNDIARIEGEILNSRQEEEA